MATSLRNGNTLLQARPPVQRPLSIARCLLSPDWWLLQSFCSAGCCSDASRVSRRSQHSQECKDPRRQCFCDLWVVTFTFDLLIEINAFPALNVAHSCVQFGDPNCIGFLPCNAMLARYIMSSCVRLSVCLSVCHTLVCTKTAKRKVTQTTPCDGPGTLVSWCKISAKFRWGHPHRGAPNRGRVGSDRRFSTNILLYLKHVQDSDMVTMEC